MANSKKKCKHCKEFFPADDMFKAPGGTFCTWEHAGSWAFDKVAEKIAKQKVKDDAWRKSMPKSVKELNQRDLKWQEDRTQTAFNKMRVQQELIWFYTRNIEPYCISCLKTKMDFCCGHNESRGSNSHLQFDEINTYLQCNKYCNCSLSANKTGTPTTIGYYEGLKHRFGDDEGESIREYCANAPTEAKRTPEEFEILRKGFNEEFRVLKPIAERAKFLFEQSQ